MTTPRHGKPLILAFDTAMAHCAAAICHDTVLAQATEKMARGQAERLMPLLDDLCAAQGVAWSDIDLIAVGIGPGNFTGIRISVAAARGLALGLGIPAVGVSMFEVLRDPLHPWTGGSEVISLAAPRGQAYIQHFEGGVTTSAPIMVDLAQLPPDLRFPADTRVVGYAAQALCQTVNARDWQEAAPQDVAERIALRAQARFAKDSSDIARPTPLYVKPPDAAPAKTAAPTLLT